MIAPNRELALFRLLRDTTTRLEQVRDPVGVLRVAARAARDYLGRGDVCAAHLISGGDRCDVAWTSRPAAEWDATLLHAFLRGERPALPDALVLVPVRRRGRSWGLIALRESGAIRDREARAALGRIEGMAEELLRRIDHERVLEVRARNDRRIMEQLRPSDLFYQILQGLASLTGCDHSAALLMTDARGEYLEVQAERISYTKVRSRRIGLKIPLAEGLRRRLGDARIRRFERAGEQWAALDGSETEAIAAALDYNRADEPGDPSLPREAYMLVAPIVTHGGVIGVLKVAALRSGVLGEYEAGLLHQFTPQISVAMQYLRLAFFQDRVLEAERKNLIATLARGVSHDVNNALGAVLPMVQQTLEDAQSGRIERETLIADLRQIEQAVQVCRRIFWGMLSIARGGVKVLSGDLARAVEPTLAVLEESLKRCGIRVELDVPAGLPPLRASQTDLEQLFLNLVTNARDAMPTGGRLLIRARRENHELRVQIEDTGQGIATADLARIQEPFFTTKSGGSGLGLSVCRSIIWEIRGEMSFDSQPGRGTCVTLRLPLDDTARTLAGRGAARGGGAGSAGGREGVA